jgi:hypothetical protein
MQTSPSVTVQTMAFLHSFCREHDLPTASRVEVPSAGITALDLAGSLGLPLELIEGVFHNCSAAGLDAVVMPGDRVAFVPPGTPASHPAFFGPFVTRR